MSASAFFEIPKPQSAVLLGWRLLAADSDTGWVRIAFDGKREFTNPAGQIQGGLLTAMLDDCMGPAVWVRSRGELYPSTLDLTVSFLAPALPGPLVGEGKVLKLGKTIGFVEAQLTSEQGELLARATSTVRLLESARAVR